MNDRFCEITGYLREELLGRDFTELVHPDDVRDDSAGFHDVLAGRITTYRMDKRFMRKNGETIWTELTRFRASPPGQPPIIVGFVQDITERQRAVDALRASDRAKTEFLAILAHEIRNPLAPMRSIAQLLATPGADTKTIAGAAKAIDRQVRTMAHMVEDLLDIARVSEGKMRLRREPGEVVAIVRRAADAIRPGMIERNQQLVLHLPRTPVFMDVDPVRMEQVFVNLLHNASKFSRDGGTTRVTVSQTDTEAGPAAQVSVRDDGVGIVAENMPYLFDMFMQADATVERSHGGLGVGLTLVRRIVELHGGQVSARSDGPDRGAEFIVTLPVVNTAPWPKAAPSRQR